MSDGSRLGNIENKLDELVKSTALIQGHLLNRGGLVDRLDKVEVVVEYHKSVLWRAAGVVTAACAVATFLGSKLAAVVHK